jgi:hypothetical protein
MGRLLLAYRVLKQQSNTSNGVPQHGDAATLLKSAKAQRGYCVNSITCNLASLLAAAFLTALHLNEFTRTIRNLSSAPGGGSAT